MKTSLEVHVSHETIPATETTSEINGQVFYVVHGYLIEETINDELVERFAPSRKTPQDRYSREEAENLVKTTKDSELVKHLSAALLRSKEPEDWE